jgi:hypothetical protein
MKPSDFLKRIVKEKHNIFFSQLRFFRTQQLRSKKLNYSWEANGYKIYPSSLTSLTMCPKRFC